MSSRASKLSQLENEKTITLYMVGCFAIAGFLAMWFGNVSFVYTAFVVIAVLSIGVAFEHKRRRQKILDECE